MCLYMYCSGMCDIALLFIFFIKQKTAYDMRIRDWSADVCSSDLPLRALGQDDARIGAVGEGDQHRGVTQGRRAEIGLVLALVGKKVIERGAQFRRQIGRAACRVRVGQLE